MNVVPCGAGNHRVRHGQCSRDADDGSGRFAELKTVFSRRVAVRRQLHAFSGRLFTLVPRIPSSPLFSRLTCEKLTSDVEVNRIPTPAGV